MTYRVTATVAVEGHNGYRAAYGLPAFLLDGDDLGILSTGHAKRIAERLIMAGRNPQTTTVDVEVVLVEGSDKGLKAIVADCRRWARQGDKGERG